MCEQSTRRQNLLIDCENTCIYTLRVCHSPLFVEIIFCKCFIRCSMTIEYLKCNFRVKNIFPKVPSRGVKVKNIEISKCSKVCLVGTLNLCLEMPDSMKKVWAQSDQCEPRKSPKTIENLLFWLVIRNYQYFGTFWTFSPPRMIRLSSNLFHQIRHLETQV